MTSFVLQAVCNKLIAEGKSEPIEGLEDKCDAVMEELRVLLWQAFNEYHIEQFNKSQVDL